MHPNWPCLEQCVSEEVKRSLTLLRKITDNNLGLGALFEQKTPKTQIAQAYLATLAVCQCLEDVHTRKMGVTYGLDAAVTRKTG